jgi:hypothetical protein
VLGQAFEAGLGVLNRLPVLAQDKILSRMLEDELRKPAGMRAGPGFAAGKDPPMTQQEGLQVLALLPHIFHRGLPRPHQLTHGLMGWIRHPDGSEFPGPVQPG